VLAGVLNTLRLTNSAGVTFTAGQAALVDDSTNVNLLPAFTFAGGSDAVFVVPAGALALTAMLDRGAADAGQSRIGAGIGTTTIDVSNYRGIATNLESAPFNVAFALCFSMAGPPQSGNQIHGGSARIEKSYPSQDRFSMNGYAATSTTVGAGGYSKTLAGGLQRASVVSRDAGLTTGKAGMSYRTAGITILPVEALAGLSVVEFAIPAGVKFVQIHLDTARATGAGRWGIRIGPAAGLEAAGYAGCVADNSTDVDAWSLEAMMFDAAGSANRQNGLYTLELLDPATNTWVFSGVGGDQSNTNVHVMAGRKSIAATLTRVAVIIDGNTWQSGDIGCSYRS
jgi:hypothetical protein